MSVLHPTSDRFLRAALDLLWAQWAAIGLAGVRASRSSVVDPEVLVVATAEFGRWDPRLFDEMLDWLVVNAALVDLARLKRLVASEPSGSRRLVAAIADFVATHEGRRPWRVLATKLPSGAQTEALPGAQPLFASPDDGNTWGELDQVFRAHGFLRNPPLLRGMSHRPDAGSPACLRFRARALTGVGARAEVLTYLWTHEWAHGRLIAERALYAKTGVARYLADLSVAKLVSSRTEGRRVLYRLEPALAAVAEPVAGYVDWASALRGVTALWRELQVWPPKDDPEYAWVSHLVQTLVAVTPCLAAEGFEYHVPDLRGWAATGGDLPVQVVGEVIVRIGRYAE